MAAVAHSPAFAKKAGVPQSVGQDFNAADKGRKFSKGGETMATVNPKMAAIMAAKRAAMQQQPGGAGSPGGAPMAPGGMGAPGMKKGGKTKKMADGGLAKKDGAPKQLPTSGRISKSHIDQQEKPKKFAKGGYVRDADGVAAKGKTKGKFI